jgi:hypothetical protein
VRRLSLVPIFLLPACVEMRTHGDVETRDVAAWELPPEPQSSGTRLIPPGPSAPRRFKRGLETHEHDGHVSALVNGKDPAFSWELSKEISAGAVTVEVGSDQAGMLQLFWANSRCPTFAEACSLQAALVPGDNQVDFVMDPASPVRALRLDPPDRVGVHLDLRNVAIERDGRMTSRWAARETAPNLELGPLGLSMTNTAPDPGITIHTLGLVADRVTAIEAIVRGPEGAQPQLFWTGPCAHFSEACSVLLEPADAGALTHRAVLRGKPKWVGTIGDLRLDPGQAAGDYRIERIALVHDAND